MRDHRDARISQFKKPSLPFLLGLYVCMLPRLPASKLLKHTLLRAPKRTLLKVFGTKAQAP